MPPLRAFAARMLRPAAAHLLWLASVGGYAETDNAVARGREVYIAEGCINCHSQYVRPNVPADVERWGPAASLAAQSDAEPPLFGNRRQGPDLSNVGLRRSPAWNQLHLTAPRSISPGSVMPSYAHLFAAGDPRGPDLLDYLSSLGADRTAERLAFIAGWRPDLARAASAAPNPALFLTLCSSCHGPTGQGDGPLAGRLQPAPPDWSHGTRRPTPPGEDPLMFLSRVIKFGLPPSAMAGHEYLSDDEIVGLARHVRTLQTHAVPSASR